MAGGARPVRSRPGSAAGAPRERGGAGSAPGRVCEPRLGLTAPANSLSSCQAGSVPWSLGVRGGKARKRGEVG